MIEEWLPRWAHNPKVAGSSPAPATKLWGCNSVESEFVLHTEDKLRVRGTLALPNKLKGNKIKYVCTTSQYYCTYGYRNFDQFGLTGYQWSLLKK